MTQATGGLASGTGAALKALEDSMTSKFDSGYSEFKHEAEIGRMAVGPAPGLGGFGGGAFASGSEVVKSLINK